MINNIKTGDKIIISKPGSDDTGVTYLSQVDMIIPPGDITALVPISLGQLIRLPLDTPFTFVFHTAKGMISFNGVITAYFQEDSVYLMRVRFTTAGTSFQRRGFFRFPCNIPIQFSETDEKGNVCGETFSGISLDISGGGMMFTSNGDADPSKRMNCVVDIGTDKILMICKVLGKSVNDKAGQTQKNDYKYNYRIEFSGILKADQEKIVRYIFNEQRRQLRTLR